MPFLFVVIFILSSHLIHTVAVDQRTGYNPYPFGTTTLCILQHPMLLTMSIFYLGWIWGIMFFLCHLFGIIHMTISWIFSIPRLIINDYNKLLRIMKSNVALLTPMLIIVLIFTILSFFTAEFKSLLTFFQNHNSVLIGAIVVVIILSIVRIIVAKKLKNEM